MTEEMQDSICHEKQKIMGQLNFLKQKNALMYFYPIKVQNQTEVLANKHQELKLYEKIIDRTFMFISERIHENENKQSLVKELNQFVRQAINELLIEED
jgi:GTPase SAR1 family protein